MARWLDGGIDRWMDLMYPDIVLFNSQSCWGKHCCSCLTDEETETNVEANIHTPVSVFVNVMLTLLPLLTYIKKRK